MKISKTAQPWPGSSERPATRREQVMSVVKAGWGTRVQRTGRNLISGQRATSVSKAVGLSPKETIHFSIQNRIRVRWITRKKIRKGKN